MQVALAVRGVLQQLPVARQVALGRGDVRVGLDRVEPQWLVAGRQPAVRGRAGQQHVVALASVQRAEHGLHHGAAGLDVHALVADRVAVQRAGLPGHHVGDPHVGVAQHQPPPGHRVDGLPVVAEQLVQLQVPRHQRCVRRGGDVAGGPRRGVDQRRRDAPVVEQRGVRGEALLAHQLLVVEPAVGTAVLGVPLRRDLTGSPVVRHRGSPSVFGDGPVQGRGDLGRVGGDEHGGDVRVRADDPHLAGPGGQRRGQGALRIDLGQGQHPGRAGGPGRRGPHRLAVDAVRGQQQEPVPRQLPEPPRPCRPGGGWGRDGGVGGSTPGPGGGTAPRGGRPAKGRWRSAVVSGESTYQNGSASRPEFTWARSVRVGGRAGQHLGPPAGPLGVRRDQEVHGRRGDLDVLPGRRVPLVVVALQQLLGRPAPAHVGDLPGRVLGVGHPGVEPARAERRDQVRGVAGQQHPADPHPVHAAGVEPVHRRPDDLVVALADDRPDARVQRAGGGLGVQVVAGRDLPVDAERRVRAGVDEHLPARVPGRVEVEPPLGGPAGQVGADVADQEAVVEGVPVEASPRAAQRSPSSRAPQQTTR